MCFQVSESSFIIASPLTLTTLSLTYSATHKTIPPSSTHNQRRTQPTKTTHQQHTTFPKNDKKTPTPSSGFSSNLLISCGISRVWSRAKSERYAATHRCNAMSSPNCKIIVGRVRILRYITLTHTAGQAKVEGKKVDSVCKPVSLTKHHQQTQHQRCTRA